MILSKKFVNDYTPLSKVDMPELANSLLKLGNEYESQGYLRAHEKLVIGKVIECKPHPKSDHLKLCRVDIKTEVLDIVCGAPNMKEGIKVIVALEGCNLPEGTIHKSTILGCESNGMCCSLLELGIDKKYLSEEDINGICILGDDAEVGEDPIKYLELDDYVIDLDLTSSFIVLYVVSGRVTSPPVITADSYARPSTLSKSALFAVKSKSIT